jgi:hypothetical protein
MGPLPVKTILATLACLATILLAPRAFAQGCGGANSGSCVTAHATPGCSDLTCCNTVCSFNPTCCSTAWDQSCADLADSSCIGLCGATASGDCGLPHSNPGCSNAECCEAVCAVDPACCQFSWDTTCVFESDFYCTFGPPVECGAAGQESCTIVHASPGCADATCCSTVCGLDPTCCSNSWDSICVALATQYCAGCTVNCPAGSVTEPEACGARTNDACASGQTATPLEPGPGVCGTIDGAMSGSTWAGDRDTYSLTLTDTDGDGKVRFTMTLSANAPVFAALVPATCPISIGTALVHANASGCTDTITAACVPPGNYRILVVPGSFPTPSVSSSISCDLPRRYRLAYDAQQAGCQPVCSSSTGPCFDAHAGVGCSDSTCCTATCNIDPFCCSQSWDTDCARTAAVSCGAPLPPNDTCASALPISVGQSIPFSTIRATAGSPALPASCETGTGIAFGTDVWFTYDGERSGAIVASTCGSITDMRIAVYEGTCAGPVLVACGSSSIVCTPTSGARVQFQAVCGTQYLIRVGGENTAVAGSATLTLASQGPICPAFCPSDLNRDGSVGGADIGLLLGNWGWFGLGDLDVNGTVNGADLGILLGDWGACP